MLFSAAFDVQAATIDLYVDSYVEVVADWTKVGSQPYLDIQDQPANYGYAGAKNLVWQEFTFADLSGSPTINSVAIYVYSDCGSEKINVYIYDTGGYIIAGALQGSGWAWRNLDISSILTTDAEVDAAKVYFEAKAQGGWTGTVSVDAAYLYVDYVEAGQNIIVDLSMSVAPGLTEAFNVDYVLTLSSPHTAGLATIQQSAFNIQPYLQPTAQVSTILNSNFMVDLSSPFAVSLILEVIQGVAAVTAYIVDLAWNLAPSFLVDVWTSLADSPATASWLTCAFLILAVTCLVIGLILADGGET